MIRAMCTVFALSLTACATTPLPSQFEGISIAGVGHEATQQCAREVISKRINTTTWKVVSTSRMLTGELWTPTDGSWAALLGQKPTIQRDKLRFARVSIRGQGYGGELSLDSICIFEVQTGKPRFIQSCDMTGAGLRCPLKFIQG
jgi:hypothetical protein